MSPRKSLWIPAMGVLAFVASGTTASAQYYGNPCACAQPIQAVAQPCYRTVPVTEYRAEKQTVQRPEVYTEYEDRQFTEYHPVTEQRTAEIPTVTYHNVTECQTVQRDYGRWVTNRIPNPRVGPCAYDNRPGFFGWLNRTGFEMRQAFTPRYRTTRSYVPNVVTQAIPVTRRVAEHGTRKVTYNVTRMEPRTTTRKVAVNKVKYVSREITVQRPVTVMRTVPIGSAIAYAPFGTPTATALAPSPDPISARSSNTPTRTAEGNAPTYNGGSDGAYKRTDNPNNSMFPQDSGGTNVNRSSYEQVVPQRSDVPAQDPQASRSKTVEPTVRVPSAVRVGRWVGRPASRQSSVNGTSLAAVDTAR